MSDGKPKVAMRFNVNNTVRVKLTDQGRKILADNPLTIVPREDDDGWSEWQLWVLMQDLGPHVFNGGGVPFETEIEILEPKG